MSCSITARMVFDSGRPIAHVARDLGIHHETLRKWVPQAEADAGKRKEPLSSQATKSSRAPRRFRRRVRPTPNEVSSHIEEHRDRFGVELICATLEVSASAYHGKAWSPTKHDPDDHRQPDLVERDFSAEEPNRLWVGDFTYLRCWEGALFFSFVIDAFSRKVVGWQLASHMRTDLVLDALRMALGQREPGADFALVAHTDRGSQYTSAD